MLVSRSQAFFFFNSAIKSALSITLYDLQIHELSCINLGICDVSRTS